MTFISRTVFPSALSTRAGKNGLLLDGELNIAFEEAETGGVRRSNSLGANDSDRAGLGIGREKSSVGMTRLWKFGFFADACDFRFAGGVGGVEIAFGFSGGSWAGIGCKNCCPPLAMS
jgi:hypothetical protein